MKKHINGASSWPRHIFACLLAASTAFLIFWGALVPSHNAGLSVPDWPTSFNKWWLWLHEMEGNVFWEHIHRVIAACVGFLTLSLTLWLGFMEPRTWVRRLSLAALAAVVAQGVLGGMTVWYGLPVAVSATHACLAQIFFCLTIALAFATSPWFVRGLRGPKGGDASRGIRRLAFATVGVVFIQLALGAVMRHSKAGLAVPDFPYAYGEVVPGQVVPSISDEAIKKYNRWRFTHFVTIDEDEDQVTRGQIVIHMAHRLWAGAVTLAILAFAGAVTTRLRRDKPLFGAALLLLALLGTQIVLGIYTVWTQKAPFVATFHVFTGALVLGCAWFMALRVWALSLANGKASAAIAAKPAAATGQAPRAQGKGKKKSSRGKRRSARGAAA